MAKITIYSVWSPKIIKSDTVSTVSPCISHEVMGPRKAVRQAQMNDHGRILPWVNLPTLSSTIRKISKEKVFNKK